VTSDTLDLTQVMQGLPLVTFSERGDPDETSWLGDDEKQPTGLAGHVRVGDLMFHLTCYRIRPETVNDRMPLPMDIMKHQVELMNWIMAANEDDPLKAVRIEDLPGIWLIFGCPTLL